MKVLELGRQNDAASSPMMPARRRATAVRACSPRASSRPDGRRIALFFTRPPARRREPDRRAGQRAAELDPPIQMCDALSRNLPGELTDDPGQLPGPRPAAVRRGGGDTSPRSAATCWKPAAVYHNDAIARKDRHLSPNSGWSFTRPKRPDDGRTAGLADRGSSRTGWSSPTRRWARPSPTCSSTGRS